VTELIDFSADFVICQRSSAFVVICNDCAVKSTVRLEMVESCNGVFSLDDTSLFEIKDRVEIKVSCYSEIHGDYKGELKLIIKDPWQCEEILIPMRVKALGSFFGFMKHTLGYTQDLDGDFVTFGDRVVAGEKVIRRLTLENFSSEPIKVNWTLANFVKGREYAKLDLDIQDDGSVVVSVEETEDASKQDPFWFLAEETMVESHGKTVVVVEFIGKESGVFRGCVAAKSGEFIRTLGLYANAK
jgi:hypothetical protein